MMNMSNETDALIRSLEDMRYSAIVDGKFDIFEEVAHPDISYTHSNGVSDTLDSYLKKCKSGFYVYHHVEHPIHSIKVLGDSVLVFGEMNGEITAGGVRKVLKNKTLAVWVKEAFEWKLLAYQPTPIA